MGFILQMKIEYDYINFAAMDVLSLIRQMDKNYDKIYQNR